MEASSFLVRRFGWRVPEAATSSGLVIIAGGLAGVLAAGLAGDALRSRGLRNGRLIVMLGSGLAATAPGVWAPLVGDARTSLALMLLTMFFMTVVLTSAAPAIQELLPNRLQGTIAALYALVITFIGIGLGPTAVAFVSNRILRDEHRIGVSLACIALSSTAASVSMGWLALGPYSSVLAERELSAAH